MSKLTRLLMDLQNGGKNDFKVDLVFLEISEVFRGSRDILVILKAFEIFDYFLGSRGNKTLCTCH